MKVYESIFRIFADTVVGLRSFGEALVRLVVLGNGHFLSEESDRGEVLRGSQERLTRRT